MWRRILQNTLIFLLTGAFFIILFVGTRRAKQPTIESVQPDTSGSSANTLGFNSPTSNTTNDTSNTAYQTSTSENAAQSESNTVNPSNATTLAPPASTTTASGSATGQTYRTPWGPVTVSVTMDNDQITDIKLVDLPNSPPSIYAEPILVDQALQAGSADIQGVSGATYTSLAFAQSLESAIAQLR